MSTRSTTHFRSKMVTRGKPEAIIYRHSDGYPEGHGKFLQEFLNDLEENVRDNRFNDPAYLAAKLVVALAREFNNHYDFDSGDWIHNIHPLDFLSVGVVQEDPYDIEYRYVVECGSGVPGIEGNRPKVKVQKRIGDWDKLEFRGIGTLDGVLAKAVSE